MMLVCSLSNKCRSRYCRRKKGRDSELRDNSLLSQLCYNRGKFFGKWYDLIPCGINRI
jgi:hypothetical protein